MSWDRGLERDIWERNLRKSIGNPLLPRSLASLLVAMQLAMRKRRNRFLGSMIRAVRNGSFPTKAQLTCINNILEERGFRRQACPVREKLVPGRKVTTLRMRDDEQKRAVDAVDAMLAQPIPPCPRRKT